MHKIFTGAVLVLCAAAYAGSDAAPQFALSHFPDAAYVDENVTFVFTGKPDLAITATLNGKLIAQERTVSDSLEINLSLTEPGRLRLGSSTRGIEFEVLRPDPRLTLVEKGGILHTEALPAILLADHRFPPKHDRRWETVKVLRSMLGDTRPAIKSSVLLGGSFIPESDCAHLDDLFGIRKGFWSCAELPETMFEIHGMIVSMGELPRGDVLVVALSAQDHEYGIDQLGFAIKLEWYLQAIEQLRYPHVFVVDPPLNAKQAEQFPYVAPQCKLSALGNRAHSIEFHESELTHPLAAGNWMQSLKRHMERTVRCE